MADSSVGREVPTDTGFTALGIDSLAAMLGQSTVERPEGEDGVASGKCIPAVGQLNRTAARVARRPRDRRPCAAPGGKNRAAQGGLQTFDAAIATATPNPPNLTELLTAPPPAGAQPGRGGAPAAGAPAGPPAPEKIGDGVFKIGGNYTSLAVDMGDHVLVVEAGQGEARGLAVMAAARQAVPNKPVRFVVNSHPHFDHAGGLAAAIALGATILTHRNNEPVLERLLAGPRTLVTDSLSKVASRRANVVQPVGDRNVRKGTNGKIPAHPPNPDRPLTRADVEGGRGWEKRRVERRLTNVWNPACRFQPLEVPKIGPNP
jgi:hypothetical protein